MIDFCPYGFWQRFGVWPSEAIVRRAAADLEAFREQRLNEPEVDEWRKKYDEWLKDPFAVQRRPVMLVRCRMIEAGWFPGFAESRRENALLKLRGFVARSKFFRTHRLPMPINRTADAVTGFHARSFSTSSGNCSAADPS